MMRGRLLSEAELLRTNADWLEYLYREGRASKADVIAWVRLSAKLSGRIYEPQFQADGWVLRLKRREHLEERLFAKRGGYWRSTRDRRSTQNRRTRHARRRKVRSRS